MERSEVIKLIEGLFEIASRHSNEDNAENLLAHLEELGMSPPPNPEATNIEGLGQLCGWEYEGENHE